MPLNLENGKKKHFLIWERRWLEQWGILDIADKKVLAALYWEELTDDQKSEFSDREYIELQKLKQKQIEERANNPTMMRQHFLTTASPLIDKMILASQGKTKLDAEDNYATKEVWEVLKSIILTANNPAPMLDLKGKTINDQIDQILTGVTEGKLDFKEAKEYMSLVSSGFNLQELPKMLAKLEMLENL